MAISGEWMSMYHGHVRCPPRPKEDFGSPGTGVTAPGLEWGTKWVLRIESHPLEKLQVLFTTEPSLQPLGMHSYMPYVSQQLSQSVLLPTLSRPPFSGKQHLPNAGIKEWHCTLLDCYVPWYLIVKLKNEENIPGRKKCHKCLHWPVNTYQQRAHKPVTYRVRSCSVPPH